MITLPSQEELKRLSLEELFRSLQTSHIRGLSSTESRLRISTFGFNEVKEESANSFLEFIRRFWGPSSWILEIIAILSLVLGKSTDLYLTLGLLFSNAVIGQVLSQRAERVVRMLQSKLQIRTRVLRDGQWLDLIARDLVPGDVIKVRMGDFIPADLKIIGGDARVDQSFLTGESLERPVATDDLVYSGSMIRHGELIGLVCLTGTKTFYGRTIELLDKSKTKFHMEEVVAKLVRWLLAIVGVVVTIVVAFGVWRGAPLTDILPLALVLLMGAIPIAFPVMFTVSTAIGASYLGKKGVLVTRLSATEDAATMQILFTDKTGTLTLNQLHVEGLYPEPGVTDEELLLNAAQASDASNRDAIDSAILTAAAQAHLPLKTPAQIKFIPFSPQTRRTEGWIKGDNEVFRVMKGEIETIISIARTPAEDRERIRGVAETLAEKGVRALAVAKSVNDEIRCVGLVGLYDPPRPDSAELIRKLRSLGISVKMLTGDALPVARHIAESLGLRGVASLKDVDLTRVEWLSVHDGLAAAFPEDKYKVIKALQDKGTITGMTGDGVNDSPALKTAEVGIAVKGATDAARAAASVVLTESGLTGIVDLIENGRAVYQRLLTWVINKVSRTALKAGFIGITFIVTGHLLVSALSILLLAFMTDFVKISLATDNVRPSQTPDTWQLGLPLVMSVILGFLMTFEAVGLLWVGLNYLNLRPDSPETRTFSFLILLFMGLFSILCFRERSYFFKSRPSRALAASLVFAGVGGFLVGWLGVGDLPPLSFSRLFVAILGSLVLSLFINDLIKVRILNLPGTWARFFSQSASN